MAEQRSFPGISGSVLKLVAVITMLIDHTAVVVIGNLPIGSVELLHIGNTSYTIYTIMRLIGRTAFPIYCFLLAEGCHYTHSPRQYGMNLMIFALISEIPWNLVHTNSLLCPTQSVYVTLLMGFVSIMGYEKFRGEAEKCVLFLGGVVLLTHFLQCDYGVFGVALIFMMYVLRENRPAACVLTPCFHSSHFWVIPASVLLFFYNGKRGFIQGRAAKYAFYAFYPVHLMILWCVTAHDSGGALTSP